MVFLRPSVGFQEKISVLIEIPFNKSSVNYVNQLKEGIFRSSESRFFFQNKNGFAFLLREQLLLVGSTSSLKRCELCGHFHDVWRQPPFELAIGSLTMESHGELKNNMRTWQ